MADQVDLYKRGQRLLVFGLTPWEKRGGDSGTTWTKIGNAHVNKDNSLSIFLDFVPNRGQTLQVRPARDEEEKPSGGQSRF
jgi:hypothetical protein